MEFQNLSLETLLLEAAEENNIQEVKTLIQNGAEIDARNCNNYTPLHFAAINGSEEMVAFLVENGAEVNAKSFCKDTPLHFKRSSLQRRALINLTFLLFSN